MKGFDAFAGVIKSGGKTRRAAKMVILNADHPDIEEFINCKVEEEKKAWALIDAGYDGSFTGPAYSSVFFQNSNNSVRVTDEFMRAVMDDGEWTTKAVRDGAPMQTYKARDLMRQIAEATHICGDPGMQFDTTVNDWHTCPNTARINASNPCSEYMFLDDSACNLSSINLMKFLREDGEIDSVVVRGGVPDDDHGAGDPGRQLELSDAGDREEQPRVPPARAWLRQPRRAADVARPALRQRLRAATTPAAITALMHGAAFAQSAKIARDHGGPFAGYEKNSEPFLRVMRKHRAALKDIDRTHVPKDLFEAAKAVWDEVIELGEQHGFRNAQATVLAPTGTIGFMMDCDTTGVEPDIALVKYKKLVGGGLMKIVNQTVPMALDQARLQRDRRSRRSSSTSTRTRRSKGRRTSRTRTCAVFDCAFKPARGVRSIHYMGHVRMMGAVQPFLSGAISKTVNVPKEATVEEIQQAYIDSWRIGAKAVSIYRDGSKRTQPLNTARDKEKSGGGRRRCRARRRRKLPDERARRSRTSSTSPGTRATSPSASSRTASPARSSWSWRRKARRSPGFADAFAQAISYALQYGVPLQDLVDKFSHVRFEPSGMTKNPDVRFAKSIVDYIFRWMAAKFLSPEAQFRAGVNNREETVTTPEQLPLDVAAAAGASATGAIALADDVRRSRRFRTRRMRRRARRAGRSWCARVVLQVRELRHDERLRLRHRDPGLGIRASGFSA